MSNNSEFLKTVKDEKLTVYLPMSVSFTVALRQNCV